MAEKNKERSPTEVFEQELLPHVDALYNFAFHLSHHEEDANDLVQETFLKAYNAIERYEKGTNPKAWLFRILKNSFINDYRKTVREPKRVQYEDYVSFHDEEDSPLAATVDLREVIFDQMLGDEVSAAVKQLPEEFRTVLLLCDIEDFSYDEIAEIMDIPVGTVRSRLHRARNFLKEKLKNYAATYGYKDKRK